MEGSKTQAECALNDLYNLEKKTTGRCDYYQDFGHKASTVRVEFGAKDAGMHQECYYHYGYGVYLDNWYKVNHSRTKQSSLKSI